MHDEHFAGPIFLVRIVFGMPVVLLVVGVVTGRARRAARRRGEDPRV